MPPFGWFVGLFVACSAWYSVSEHYGSGVRLCRTWIPSVRLLRRSMAKEAGRVRFLEITTRPFVVVTSCKYCRKIDGVCFCFELLRNMSWTRKGQLFCWAIFFAWIFLVRTQVKITSKYNFSGGQWTYFAIICEKWTWIFEDHNWKGNCL